MIEDLLNPHRILDTGDDSHGPAAGRAGLDIDPANQFRASGLHPTTATPPSPLTDGLGPGAASATLIALRFLACALSPERHAPSTAREALRTGSFVPGAEFQAPSAESMPPPNSSSTRQSAVIGGLGSGASAAGGVISANQAGSALAARAMPVGGAVARSRFQCRKVPRTRPSAAQKAFWLRPLECWRSMISCQASAPAALEALVHDVPLVVMDTSGKRLRITPQARKDVVVRTLTTSRRSRRASCTRSITASTIAACIGVSQISRSNLSGRERSCSAQAPRVQVISPDAAPLVE